MIISVTSFLISINSNKIMTRTHCCKTNSISLVTQILAIKNIRINCLIIQKNISMIPDILRFKTLRWKKIGARLSLMNKVMKVTTFRILKVVNKSSLPVKISTGHTHWKVPKMKILHMSCMKMMLLTALMPALKLKCSSDVLLLFMLCLMKQSKSICCKFLLQIYNNSSITTMMKIFIIWMRSFSLQ